MDSNNTPILAYGSLMNPVSLVSRFNEFDVTADDVYSGKTDNILREEGIDKWNKEKSRINTIPIKVQGFRRYYSVNSDRGNTMLEIIQTENNDDWINGILITGLRDSEYAQISNTESPYGYKEITNPGLDFYNLASLSINKHNINSFKSFIRHNSIENIHATNPRNEIYDTRIRKGIQLLGNEFENKFTEKFLKDFDRTTYEINNGEFVPLAQLD